MQVADAPPQPEVMMQAFLILLALGAGVAMTVQVGINAALQAGWARHPLLAALVSFAVGTLSLAIAVGVFRIPIPAPHRVPWWQWTGGMLGAFLVTTVVYAAPRLGATALLALGLAGQMVAAVILDHYGLLGYAEKPVNAMRLLGLVLMAAGVWCIRRY